MDAGIYQQSMLPGDLFGVTASVVRPPQLVTSPPSAKQQASEGAQAAKLAQRLDAVLRGFVEGFACDGADFYSLNSASNELALRSSYRAGETESGANRRPLQTARADVAAMAGSAIVLEDDLDVAAWLVPVWCGAAVCLPVASDETVYGTVWLYSNEPRTFAAAELQLAEVVAGRLALEMELNTWRSGGTGCDDPAPTPVKEVAEPAISAAPVAATNVRIAKPASTPMLEDWELAGWAIDSPAPLAFYDWQTLADGRTLVVAGSVTDEAYSLDGWLQAARIALRSHAAGAHDAGELLTHANQTLWLASPGGEGLAVAVALLEGDGIRTSIASAGGAGIARWRAAQCEWTPATCPPLGWSERAVYAPKNTELLVRERLVLVTSPEALPSEPVMSRVADRLRNTDHGDLRTMPGKRALRAFAEAAGSAGFSPTGLALARRR